MSNLQLEQDRPQAVWMNRSFRLQQRVRRGWMLLEMMPDGDEEIVGVVDVAHKTMMDADLLAISEAMGFEGTIFR